MPDPFEDVKLAIDADPFKDVRNITAQQGAPDPISTFGAPSQDSEEFLPIAGGNLQEFKARRQPWYSQAFNSVVGGIASGGLTAVEDIGYILDFDNNIQRLQGIQEVESNWLSDLAKEGKEGISANLPIYKRSNKVFDWGDSGFYWTALKGILDSAVGFGATGVVGGAAIKAAVGGGKIAKLLTLASRGRNAERTSSFLRGMAETGRLTEQAVQQLGTAALLNYGEGKMMALETYENVMESLKPRIETGEISEEDAQKIAGEQADNFQLRNLAFIATDAFALSGIFRGKGLTRNLLEARTAKNLGKNLLQQAPVEYFEEVSQNVLQQEAEYQAKVAAGEDVSEYSSKLTERALAFAMTDQAQLEGLMGLFGGPAQFAAVQLPFYLAGRKGYNESYQDQQKQIQANQEYMENKRNFLLNGFAIKEEATVEDDSDIGLLMDKSIFRETAVANFERGTTNDFEQRLENYAQDEDNDSKEIASRLVRELRDLERDWLKATSYPNAREIFSVRQQLKDFNSLLTAKEGKFASSTTEINNKIAKALDTPANRKLVGIVTSIEDLENIRDNSDVPNDRRIAKRVYNKIAKSPEFKKYNKYKQEIDLIDTALISLDEQHEYMTSKEGIRDAIERNKAILAAREEEVAKEEITKNKEAAAQKDIEEKEREMLEDTSGVPKEETPSLPEAKAPPEDIPADIAAQLEAEKPEKFDVEAGTEAAEAPEIEEDFPTVRPEDIEGQVESEDAKDKEIRDAEIKTKDKENLEEAKRLKEAAKETEVYTTAQDNKVEDEQEKVDKEFNVPGKLTEPSITLAYLSREYERISHKTRAYRDINNYINTRLLDKEILDYKSYPVGSKITLEIDTDLEYIDDDGNPVTYTDLLSKGEDFIPIIAKKNGQPFAHLHIPEWINSDTTETGIVNSEIDRLRQIRRKVIEEGSITTTIINRTSGKLIRAFDNKLQKVTTSFPDPELSYGVVKDGTLTLTKANNKEIINEGNLREGLTYALLPTSDTQVIAVPLNQSKLDPEVIVSIKLAVEAYLAGTPTEATEQLGEEYPILTEQGLRDYIRLFTSPFRFDGETNLKTYLANAKSNITMLDITGGAIEFGRGAGQKFYSISKTSPNKEALLRELGAHLQDMYTNVNISLLNTSTGLPIMTSKTTVKDRIGGKNYNDYIKDNLLTNLLSANVGTEENPNYVYTIQPIITIDDSFAFPKEVETKTPEEKEIIEEDKGIDTPEGTMDFGDIGDEDLSPLTNRNVQYRLRAISIMQSPKGIEIFNKGKKNNWSLNKILSELQIPKVQKKLVLDKNITDREELITALLADNTHTVRIDRSTATFHGSLTVPGGTNYNENEIATPDITPIIEGHAQFSTEHGIGWFRSDDKAKTRIDPDVGIIKETRDTGDLLEDAFGTGDRGISTKTRRVLEIQSDLFQKGRDKENLILNRFADSSVLYSLDPNITEEEVVEEQTREEKKLIKSDTNKFLQLLNKDNRWVRFFIDSILQDSKRKNYEKVLFPSGNTANKVEGQETVDEFIRVKQERLQEITNDLEEVSRTPGKVIREEIDDKLSVRFDYKGNTYQKIGKGEDIVSEKEDKYRLETADGPPYTKFITRREFANAWLNSHKNRINKEITQLEGEIKDAREGRTSFASINKFYENTIFNILKKRGYEPKRITDEYDNTWFEVGLDKIDIDTVDLAPLTERQINRIQNNLTSGIIIRELGETRQRAIVSTLARSINKRVQEEADPIPFDEVFKEWENSFEKGKEHPEIKKLLDNWDAVKIATRLYIKRLRTVRLTEKDDFELGMFEQSNFEEMSIEQDGKDQISAKLRRFLAGITDLKQDFTPKKNFYGLPKIMDFDIVYNTVSRVLANTEASYENMIRLLEENTVAHPFLRDVIDQLTVAPQDIKNSFVVAMTKHYVPMKFVMWSERGLELWDSNANSVSQVIKDTWINNLALKDYVEVDDNGNDTITTKKIEELINTSNPWTRKKPSLEELDNWFRELGIELNPLTLEDLKRSGIGRARSYNAIFNASSGVVGLLRKGLNKIKDRDNELDIGEVFNNSVIFSLARLDSKYTRNVFSNSHKSGNKTVYSYSANKLLVDRTRALLNNDKEVLTKLKNSPFSSNSSWLEKLTDTNDNVFKSVFSYNYVSLEALKQKGSKSRDNRDLPNLANAEHELVKVGMFQSSSTPTMFYPTMSDKSTMLALTIPKVDVILKQQEGSPISDTTTQLLYESLVLPEINRMVAYTPDEVNIKGYNRGANRFHFIPELNEIAELFVNHNTPNQRITAGILDNDTLLDKVKDTVRTHVENLINDKVDTWNNLGLVPLLDNRAKAVAGKKVVDVKDTTRYMAADFVINYLISNANIYQLYIGDPALYTDVKKNTLESTFNNIGKRLAADIAPGQTLADSHLNQYKTVFLKDRVSTSVIQDYYDELGYDYKDIESTDAQEFTTWQEHLYVLRQLGRITDNEFDLVTARLSKNKTLPAELRVKVFQPMKPVYTNMVYDDKTKIHRRVYIKSSSIPLLPELTKGLEIDKLRIAMENGTIDRAAFSSAVKVGDFESSLDIWNDDGSINGDKLTDINNYILPLPREGFRIQQDIPYKESKQTINIGTQERKLLFLNLLHIPKFKKLHEEYNSHYSELFKIHRRALEEEIKDNPRALSRILRREAEERNFPLNAIEGLELDKDGNFVLPLWATSTASKYESLLNSIVSNRVIKQKFPGHSYVLATEEGFRKKDPNSVTGIVFTDSYDPELGLQPMREDKETGKMLPAQIIVPSKIRKGKNIINMKRYINENGKFLLDKDLLKLFGFRIPTQGPNSMASVEIVGFLPKDSGDAIIAPRDFIKQMGSDFDVDKLYTYQYNTIWNKETQAPEIFRYTDELAEELFDDKTDIRSIFGETEDIAEEVKLFKEQLKAKDLQNKIIDIHYKVLEDPDFAVQKQRARPLEFGLLPDLAAEIDATREKKALSPLSDEYQKFKFMNATAGKAGVGVFSLDSVFNALAQDKKLSFKDINITIGNRTNGNLSDPFTLKGERFKSEVIEAFQSASVDNEKEQLLDKLNVNNYTFDVIRSMAQLGFEEDAIVGIINQPIVIDYIDELRKLKQSISGYVANAEQTAADNTGEKYRVEGKIDPETPIDTVTDIPVSDLMDMIKNREAVGGYHYTQIGTLGTFLEFQKLGKEIAKIQGAISIDSRGIGKSIFESINKEKNIKLLPGSPIVNAEKLVGNYIGGGIALIEPETVAGFATTEGLFTNNRLWSKYFPYENSYISKTIDRVMEIAPKDFDFSSKRKAEQQNEIWNEMKSYIYSDIIPDSEITRHELVLGKESLSRYMQKLKNTRLFISNGFLNKLGYDVRGNKNLIKFNAASAENFDEIGIYGGFLDLILNDTPLPDRKGKPYSTRQLGEDLVKYALLSGGQQQAIEFSKYIPIAYLKETDFFKKMNNLKFEELFPNTYINDFVDYYFGHNPDKLPQVTDLKKLKDRDSRILSKLTRFTLDDPTMIVTRGDKRMYPEFVSIHDRGKYHRFRNMGKHYQRVGLYGVFGMKEYGATKSIYKSNNIGLLSVPTTDVNMQAVPGPESVTNNNRYLAGAKYGFKEGANLSKVLENISKKGETEYVRQLAKVLANSNINAKIRIDNNLPALGRAEYNPNVITINQEALDDYEFIRVLLHEVIHIATKQVIKNPRTKEQKAARTRLEILWKDFREEIGEGKIEEVLNKISRQEALTEEEAQVTYAGKNLEEFITLVMISGKLQDRLKQSKYKTESFFQRLLSIVKEILRSLDIPINTKAGVAIADAITLITTNESGDLSYDTTQDLSPRFRRNRSTRERFKDPLLGTIKGQIRDIEKRLASVQGRMRNVKDKAVLKRLSGLEAQFKGNLTELRANLEEAQKTKALEDILIFGEEHMKEVEAILSKPKLSESEIHYATRLIHLWSDPINTFFNEDEKTSYKLREDFGRIQIKAGEYEDRLAKISQDVVRQFVRERTGKTEDLHKIFDPKKDIHVLTRELLDISRTDDLILQAVHRSVKDANTVALEETREMSKKLDDLIQKATKTRTEKELFDLFKQSYRDGGLTGNLVYRFSQEFFDAKRKNVWGIYGDTKPKKRDIDKAIKWSRVNEIVFDPAGSNDAELKEQLGEKGFKFYKERFKDKLERYELEKELEFDRIDVEPISDAEKQAQKDIWEATNSPYEYFKNIKTGRTKKIGGNYIRPKGYHYTYVVPRRTIDGKQTGWYDSKFDQIEKDEALLELYNFMTDTLGELNSYLPEYKKRELQVNTIPTIKKTITENFSEQGMKIGLSALTDEWAKSIRDSDISNIDLSPRDPITKEVERTLHTGFARTDRDEIEKIVKRRVIFYEQDNNQKPSKAQVEKFRREAMDALAREKSFDLNKVLKMYSTLALSYKHKSRIEDQVKLAQSVFNSIKKQATNVADNELEDGQGDPVAAGQLENYKKQLDFFMDQFWGSKPPISLVSKKKALTKKEKELKEELEKRLDEGGLDTDQEKELRKQLDDLGGVIVGTEIIDNILKFTQLKGMGWNLFSAFANMGFGAVANMVEASDGRNYNMKQYRQAMSIAKASVGKNLTFHTVSSQTAKKVRVLMDDYDVLKDASQELYRRKTSTIANRFKFLQPYQLQKRSEYLNQAPVMIAMMLNTEMVDKSGNVSNLWEAYNEKGKLKEEFRTEENISKWEGSFETSTSRLDFKAKVDRVIKKNHGNYDPDSPIRIKESVWGKAFVQFRTWALEGFANRFEKRSPDSTLGYAVEGRYRTLARFIGDNPIGNTLFTLKQLFRKMAGQSTNFQDKLIDETDIANMRANLTELLFLMFFFGMTMLIKYGLLGEDDDKEKYLINTSLNLMLRMQTDILFYFEPSSFEALSRNAVPAMGLVQDAAQWFNSAGKLIIGDDEIKTGVYAGHSRFLRETMQMLPFGVQGYRMFSTATQQFDK